MSDSTPVALVVYRAKGKGAKACREVISEYGLTEAGEGGYSYDYEDGFDLRIGERWADYDGRTGEVDEIATMLISRAKDDVWFSVQDDPVYEWLGSLILYAPHLGRADFECDAGGNPVFRGDDVRKMVDMTGAERQRALGTPWFDEFRRLTPSAS